MYEDWRKQEANGLESLLTIPASPMPWIITIFDRQRSMNIMFKQVNNSFVLLVAMLLYLAGANLYGQQQSADIQELKEATLASYDQGNYRLALP